jgi:hypothetical protein
MKLLPFRGFLFICLSRTNRLDETSGMARRGRLGVLFRVRAWRGHRDAAGSAPQRMVLASDDGHPALQSLQSSLTSKTSTSCHATPVSLVPVYRWHSGTITSHSTLYLCTRTSSHGFCSRSPERMHSFFFRILTPIEYR